MSITLQDKEVVDCLKFLSQTHRSLHDQRRKCDFEVLIATISFYVIAVAGRFSGKITIPTSEKFVALVWIACVGLSVVASAFLWRLHTANRKNMKLAMSAEDALINILSKIEVNIEKPPSENSSSCGFHFGWFWQSLILVIFAIECSLLLTVT